MPIVYGSDRLVTVSKELAESFRVGDRLVVVQDTGDLLHVPAAEWHTARVAVDEASDAFAALQHVSNDAIAGFFEAFASNLEDDERFEPIAAANKEDVGSAAERGRSTTRLVLSERMRGDMIDGLRLWAKTESGRGQVIETIVHDGWRLEQIRSGLGVVGFVFEGRPNVVADATGVVHSGNSVVMRIGSDALGTARALLTHALAPALEIAGLPPGTVSLVDTPSRAAGWAMFADTRLGLAVARGSGSAVSQLGAVARQSGTPVSLHGTGGAWIVVSESADPSDAGQAVFNSLDRKVCNTLNTLCVVEDRADELIPVLLDALQEAGERLGTVSKLHIAEGDESRIPDDWFATVPISRSRGDMMEPRTEMIPRDQLGREWEWEASPEITLAVVRDVEAAIELFNQQSPKFAASLISSVEDEHRWFFDQIDAPFVGSGFTRWVDGQYALNRPELGLSNWQGGRLLGRGGILSGDSVFTVRARVIQDDPNLGR